MKGHAVLGQPVSGSSAGQHVGLTLGNDQELAHGQGQAVERGGPFQDVRTRQASIELITLQAGLAGEQLELEARQGQEFILAQDAEILDHNIERGAKRAFQVRAEEQEFGALLAAVIHQPAGWN